jgi:hypothetical protein
MLKKYFLGLFFLQIFFSQAQCAMCRAALESSGDNATAQAVNDGIVFLMAIPYILVGILGFVIYKLKFSKKNIYENKTKSLNFKQ